MGECPHYPPEERAAVRRESRHEERSDEYWQATRELIVYGTYYAPDLFHLKSFLVVLGFLHVEIEMLLGIGVQGT